MGTVGKRMCCGQELYNYARCWAEFFQEKCHIRTAGIGIVTSYLQSVSKIHHPSLAKTTGELDGKYNRYYCFCSLIFETNIMLFSSHMLVRFVVVVTVTK
jgi:hypothetical protein